MKKGFHLKLGIGIVVVFSLLYLGFLVYEPVWFRAQEWRLKSDNAETRAAVVDAVAAKGRRALPCVRRWLYSKDTLRIESACHVLDKIDGDIWKDALEALDTVLDNQRSKATDAVVELMKNKKFDWHKRYAKHPVRLLNVYSYYLWFGKPGGINDDSKGGISAWEAAISLARLDEPASSFILLHALEKGETKWMRGYSAYALGEIGDNRATEPLITALENDSKSYVRLLAADALKKIGDKRATKPLIAALENDSDYNVRCNAAGALGEIGDKRATEPLITALENDSHSTVRWHAAIALGKIGDKHATEPLITVLKNNSNSDVRSFAAYALGAIGDKRATEPLITALENDSFSISRLYAAKALGAIGDKRAIEPLITALENDSDFPVRNWVAIALTGFNSKNAGRALLYARQRGNPGADIALAWLNGGEDLEHADKPRNRLIPIQDMILIVRARWGNVDAIGETINKYNLNDYVAAWVVDLFSRMPEGFPEYDFKANYAVRKKQLKAVKTWYNKNKARIVWDEDKRRYYLKNEE
jgi:HEAT repeat protein